MIVAFRRRRSPPPTPFLLRHAIFDAELLSTHFDDAADTSTDAIMLRFPMALMLLRCHAS